MGYTIFPDGKHGEATEEAYREIMRAKALHPGEFPTLHHGYAVALEEVDELWDEVKKKHPNKEALRKEAIQCAAMFIRFAAELT